MAESYRGVEDTPPAIRGTWTIRLAGGPRETARLAALIGVTAGRHLRAGSSGDAAIGRLVAALERAEFTPEPEKP